MGPRKSVWIENNKARCMGTGAGTFTTYEGEFVLVVAGRSLAECRRLFCDMLRSDGEFTPDE
jgi:hypothetical protein